MCLPEVVQLHPEVILLKFCAGFGRERGIFGMERTVDRVFVAPAPALVEARPARLGLARDGLLPRRCHRFFASS